MASASEVSTSAIIQLHRLPAMASAERFCCQSLINFILNLSSFKSWSVRLPFSLHSFCFIGSQNDNENWKNNWETYLRLFGTRKVGFSCCFSDSLALILPKNDNQLEEIKSGPSVQIENVRWMEMLEFIIYYHQNKATAAKLETFPNSSASLFDARRCCTAHHNFLSITYFIAKSFMKLIYHWTTNTEPLNNSTNNNKTVIHFPFAFFVCAVIEWRFYVFRNECHLNGLSCEHRTREIIERMNADMRSGYCVGWIELFIMMVAPKMLHFHFLTLESKPFLSIISMHLSSN